MKKITLLLAVIALIGVTSCKNDKSSQSSSIDDTPEMETNESSISSSNDGYPEITFDEALYDFGTLQEGDVVEHIFTYTNTGKQPLKVSQAKPSCGCTAPDWSREEIAPGDTGTVTVRFDSKGQPGQQNKSVTLITNTQGGNETVRFTAFVER